MNDILGAAFLIAAIAVFHAGKWAVRRRAAARAGRSLVGEIAALGVAALSAVGLILLAREVAANLDARHVAELAGTVVVAWVLSRQLGAAMRRAAARRHPQPAAAVPH